jgi:hypothetical protein
MLATPRRNAMHTVDSILQQLDEGRDIKEIRAAITDLIEHHLQTLKGSFGYWKKTHFANAITALARNIHSSHQPTTAWLQLCLVNVEKALVPANQRNEDYPPLDKLLEAITHEQLIEEINSLRQKSC